jgi:hypothetical protein
MPLDTGGVRTLGGINPGAKAEVSQRFQVSRDLANVGYTSMSVTVSYTDATGEPFTSTYSLTLGLAHPCTTGQPSHHTGTVGSAPADGDQHLSRGCGPPAARRAIFNLELNISNLGNSEAKAVTMVLGGSASSVDHDHGTPQPGDSGGWQRHHQFCPAGQFQPVLPG